jgi:hypothetical protein
VTAVRGRRTSLLVRVLRGSTPVARTSVTLRWVGRPISWRVRTDARGLARVVLSGNRAGRLVARVGSVSVQVRVLVRTPVRRR